MRLTLISEKFKALLRKCSGFFGTLKKKTAENKNSSPKLNRLIRSSVALVLMIVLFVTITFSWMMSSFTSSITNNNYITIDADAGLQMNYGEEQNPDGSININKALREGFKLHECSSTDGRNIFFPTYEYSANGDKNFVNNVVTSDLVFREATANDKNTKYISVDFTLASKEETDVWLSPLSYIKCDSSTKTANAIRIAFVDKSVDGGSIVFDNTADTNYKKSNYAVSAISTQGNPTTKGVTPNTINEYTFGNGNGTDGKDLVLFHIDPGETLRASMIVWLEGTDPDCTNEVLDIQDLEIYIKFTTSYESMRTITFIDNTLEKWVEDDECYIYIIDNNNKLHEMNMSANYDNDFTWTADIPEGVTNIRFARYNPAQDDLDKPMEWNYWDAGELGSCSTYYAIGHSAGLWATNFVPEAITIFDGTRSGWLRSSDECEFLIKYTVTDGNGKSQAMSYKMSYQVESNRYSIIIPKNVTQVSFHRVFKETFAETGNNWTYLNRGTNTYYAITDNNAGYWGSRYIYIQDAAGMHNGCTFAGYFYDNNTNTGTWTGMHSRDDKNHGWYVAVVPYNKLDGVVFARYNKDANAWNWDNANVYNQLRKDLEVYNEKNLFKTERYEQSGDKSYIVGTWYKTTD